MSAVKKRISKHVQAAEDFMQPRTFEQFYDGFTNCRATQEGIKDDKISSKTRKTLDVYFKRAYAGKPAHPIVEKLPPPYAKLLSLQDKSGKWTNLQEVLACLDMPEDTTLNQNLQEWEEATVFGIAAIRQRPELAEKLMDAHDLAFQWISSRGFITMAIEMIFCFREPDYKKQYKASRDRSGLPVARLSDFVNTTVAPTVGELSSTLYLSTLNTGGSLDEHVSIVAPEVDTANEREGHSSAVLSLQKILAGDLKDKQSLSEEAERMVLEQQNVVISCAAEFDHCAKEVRRCVDRCIRAFRSATTHDVRNKSFDELTCMLGPGMPPLPGVSDWRKHGAPSFRAACLQLLSSIHRLAELRLDAQEAYINWQGRPAIDPDILPELKNARWTFTWEGEDVVLKLLHSLDWMQSNRDITGWYGRPFSFSANPLALPMSMVQLFNNLDMESKTTEQLEMRPFRRTLCGVDGAGSAWKQREYILKWQPRFDEACRNARLSTLWPITPETIHFDACERLYTALVVLFVKGRESIMRRVAFEQTTLSNKSLQAAMKYSMKVALGPGGGKKSSKWRGTFDIAAGRDTSAVNQRHSSSAGTQYAQVLPKLSRRPTMPWPKDDIDNAMDASVAGSAAGKHNEEDSVRARVPLTVDAPLELHLSIKTSPEKKEKVKKKTKKSKPEEPLIPDVITLVSSKPTVMKKSSTYDSDDNSTSTASYRLPSKPKPTLEPIVLDNVKILKHKKGKKGKKGLPDSPVKKKTSGITSKTVGSPIAGGRNVIARASFPTDVKLTRKVATPSKIKKNKIEKP